VGPRRRDGRHPAQRTGAGRLFQDGAEPYALSFSIPMDTPGLIFLCRDSAVATNGNTFDRPLSSRFDEQDAFVIFDDVEIPKDRVFVNGQRDFYNSALANGFFPNMQQHTTIRALIKLQFALGLVGCPAFLEQVICG
jgi:4-hydroxyphenylacetate 3-monooxygenase